MQVLAHRCGLGHREQRVFTHVFGVWAHVANSSHARHFADCAKEGCELRRHPNISVTSSSTGERQVAPV